jgi:tetratricopeptide (TPR) repeat protein
MAPEQLTGQRADPRADQFAFCVALAEALGGARPFSKNTPELVRAGPTLRTTPRLSRALQRGLSASPDDRFPSMHLLLEALEPTSLRAQSLVAPLAAVLGVALVAGVWLRQRGELCASGPERVSAVWSSARQGQLRAHFASLGGEDTFQRIAAELDRWTTTWAAQHREACEATRLRGEQSDQVFTVRMACLDRRLVDLEGALGVLATTSADSLPRAQDPVLALTPLTVCTNAAALLAPVPRPEAPAMRARVEAIERELARAQALRESGRFTEGLPLATTAALEAHDLGWAPLEAEALFVRGQLLEGESNLSGAESALRDAFARAHAARDDRLATLAAIELSFVSSQQAHLKEADEWVWQASALAPRVGVDWELASKLANQQGHLHAARTDFASAEVRYRTAWELRRDHQGPSHPKTVSILANLANALGAQGRYEASAELLTEAARQLEASLGRSHHKVGQAWNGVAEQYIALHRPAEALALIEGIFPAQLKALGPTSQYVGRLRYGRAEALRGLGRLDEAMAEYQQALEVFERASMPLMAGISLHSLGTTACQKGRLDDGLGFAHRARTVLVEAFGEAHEEATVALEVEAECLLEAGQPARALPVFTHSLEARAKAGDDDWTARSRVGLGRTQLALGRKADARPLLSKAVTSLERSKLDAVLLEKARAALAASGGPLPLASTPDAGVPKPPDR